jgi:hypothetical protein
VSATASSALSGDFYTVLSSIYGLLQASTLKDGAALTNKSLDILDDAASGKSLILQSEVHQLLLVAIYGCVVEKSPGFVVRRILNAMLQVWTLVFYIAHAYL